MNSGILIAHPLKHHAFHLAAGCQRSGRPVRLLTPLYRKGVGELLSRAPGSVGRKAAGYMSPRLDQGVVDAPIAWQLRRLLAQNRDLDQFAWRYDHYVAQRIACGDLQPSVLVTLQDYMPRTVAAAKKRGCLIWSDQISNQSFDALARVEKHHAAYGSFLKDDIEQIANKRVLSVADVVTVPSSYALGGISGLLPAACATHVVPYGADSNVCGDHERRGSTIVVVARANSVRKGGPAFIEVLSSCGSELLASCGADGIDVRVIGELDDATARVLEQASLPSQIRVSAGAVPHSDMPKFLHNADLFVMPALSESMSLMCIEAMQAGLPCVITAYCGIDIFRDGVSGIEIGDSRVDIERGLRAAFANRARWPEWGGNARNAACAFTWEAYEKRIADIAGWLS